MNISYRYLYVCTVYLECSFYINQLFGWYTKLFHDFLYFVVVFVIIKPTTFDEHGQNRQIQAVADCGSSWKLFVTCRSIYFHTIFLIGAALAEVRYVWLSSDSSGQHSVWLSSDSSGQHQCLVEQWQQWAAQCLVEQWQQWAAQCLVEQWQHSVLWSSDSSGQHSVWWSSDSSGQHQCFRLKIFMQRFTLQLKVSSDTSLLLTTYFVT